MYETTEKFNSIILGGNRTFQAKIKIGDTNLISGFRSIKLYARSVADNNISIGGAVSTYVEIEMWKPDIQLENTEFEISIGLFVDEDVEYVPLGLFTPQKPLDDDGVIQFVAYDRIFTKMSGGYFSELSYPADGKDVLDEISAKTGVPVENSNLPNGIMIPKREVISEAGVDDNGDEVTSITYEEPFNGYTYREALGYIAQLYGKFASVNRFGVVVFRWYADANYVIGTNRYYDDLITAEQVFTVGGISCKVGNKTLTAGAGMANIQLENPIMTEERLDAIYEQVKGLMFLPAGLSFFGDMRIDLGDIVTVNDKAGNIIKIPIMSITQDFDGGLLTQVQSYGKTEAEADGNTGSGPTAQKLDRIYTDLFLVKELVGSKADFDYVHGKVGEFDALSAKEADFELATANQFIAQKAEIEKVSGEFLSFRTGEFEVLKARQFDFETATGKNFSTINGNIENLKSKNAQLETAIIGKASVTDLDAIRTRTQLLETDVAGINTLINGNLTSDNIQSLVLTSDKVTVENGFIKSAMIESLAADKVTGLDINTTKLTVHSEDGRSTWTDNTIQISDANRVRVQIGEDASGDYTLAVWDKTGKLIWDALGATENTIQRKIIKDAIVADDAAIQGSKLDIESVVQEVNGASTKLKSTTILLDDKGQTLDVAFNMMESTVVKNLSEARSYADEKASEALSGAQGYADSKDAATLSSAQKYALNQANSALASARTYADAAVDGLEIGGRNLWKNATFDAGLGSYQTSPNEGMAAVTSGYSGHNGIRLSRSDYTGTARCWIHTKEAPTVKEYVAGDTFTLSAWIYVEQQLVRALGQRESAVMVRGSAGDKPQITIPEETPVGAWTYFKTSFEASADGTFENCYVLLGANGSMIVSNIKLEKGNTATGWTPAPEDAEAEITDLTEITTTHTTSITTMQGQISSLIAEDTAIKGDHNALVSRYNATAAEVDSIKITIGEHTTLLDSQGEDILAVTSKANTIESDLAGTKQTVSAVQSDLAGTKSRITTVETGLDGLQARVSATETALTKKADGVTVDSLTSRVAVCETTLDGFETSLTAVNKTVSDNYTALLNINDGYGIKWNYSAFSTANPGEAYICARDPLTGKLSDANGFVMFGGIKRTVPKGMINPNTYVPYNRTVYLVLRLSSASATTGALYLVWYNGGWRSGNINASTSTTISDWTWENATDIVLASFVEPGSEAAFVDCRIHTPALTSQQVTQGNSAYLNAAGAQTTANAAKNTADANAAVVATHTEQISVHDTRITAAEDAISLKVSASDFSSYKTTVNSKIATVNESLSATNQEISVMKGQIALKVEQADIDTAVESIETTVDNRFSSYSTTAQMQAAITAAKDSVTQKVSETYATKSQVNTVSGNVTSLTSRVSAAESKLTKDSLVTTIGSYYATTDNLNYANSFIIGTQTAVTGTWTGKAAFSTLRDGQQITYWLPFNGSGNATLNLTLSDGETTGAIPCYYSGTSRLATHYAAGNSVRLTYRENVTIGSTTITKGWWADANYDSNTMDRIRYQSAIKAKSAIASGRLIVSNGTGYFHVTAGTAFDTRKAILWAGSAVASGATGTNNYSVYSAVNVAASKSGWTGKQYASLYLVGTLSGVDFTPNDTMFTTTVPTEEDGLTYILLGQMYSTTNMVLFSEHPMYRHVGGAFQKVEQGALTVASQTLDRLQWIVSSGTNSTDFTLTDRTASLVAKTISLNGNVKVDGTMLVDGAVTADKIATDAIKSRNYAYSSGNFSTAGTFLDLSTGLFRSKNFAIDSSGNAYFRGALSGATGSFSGDVTATNAVIKDKIKMYAPNAWGDETRYDIITATNTTGQAPDLQIGNGSMYIRLNGPTYIMGSYAELHVAGAAYATGINCSGKVSGNVITSASSIYTNAKTSAVDGIRGICVGADAGVYLTGDATYVPRINFMYNGATATQAQIRSSAANKLDLSASAGISLNASSGVALISSASCSVSTSGAITLDNGEYILGLFRGETKLRVAADYDNKVDLGSSGARWTKVWAASGTIGTSDERDKDILGAVDGRYKKLYMTLEPILYRWRDNTIDRKAHIGLGAQTTERSALACGITPAEIGMIEHDFWTEPLKDGRTDRYGMNYQEVVVLTVPVVQEHEKRLDAHESLIAAVQSKEEALQYRLAQALVRISEQDAKIARQEAELSRLRQQIQTAA